MNRFLWPLVYVFLLVVYQVLTPSIYAFSAINKNTAIRDEKITVTEQTSTETTNGNVLANDEDTLVLRKSNHKASLLNKKRIVETEEQRRNEDKKLLSIEVALVRLQKKPTVVGHGHHQTEFGKLLGKISGTILFGDIHN